MRRIIDSLKVDNVVYGIGSTYVDEKITKLLNSKQSVLDSNNKLPYEFISNVPKKLSDFVNDLGFITSIPEGVFALKEHTHPQYLTEHQSLNAYSTREEVENKIKSIVIPKKLSELLNDVGFVTKVPKRTSELINDSGFLTEHQSLSDYTRTEDLAKVALSGSYNDLKYKPFIPTKVSSLINDEDYQTGKEVAEAINTAIGSRKSDSSVTLRIWVE